MLSQEQFEIMKQEKLQAIKEQKRRLKERAEDLEDEIEDIYGVIEELTDEINDIHDMTFEEQIAEHKYNEWKTQRGDK